jgi:hypothetical protein
MNSFKKAIKLLTNRKTAQPYDYNFGESDPLETHKEEDFTTDLESSDEEFESLFDKPEEEEITEEDEQLYDTLFEQASYKTKKLLKIANKLLKISQEKDQDFDDDDWAFDDEEAWGASVVPKSSDAWYDEEIPDEYKMEQMSEDDVDQIFGIDEEGPYSYDKITDKKHRDLEPDISMLDEDFEEKVSEPPSEIEDFIRQMELELDKDKELEPVAFYKNKFTKRS